MDKAGDLALAVLSLVVFGAVSMMIFRSARRAWAEADGWYWKGLAGEQYFLAALAAAVALIAPLILISQ